MHRVTLRLPKTMTAKTAAWVVAFFVLMFAAVAMVLPSKAHATGFCLAGEQTAIAVGTPGSGYTLVTSPSRLATFDASVVKIAPPATFPGLTIITATPTAGHTITDYRAVALTTVTTGDRLGPWTSLELFLAFDNLGQFPYRIDLCLD